MTTNLKSHDRPEMSVVIVTPDCYETIRKTIACLRTQTVRSCIEIIIVAPSADKLAANESELQPFHSVRVAEIGEVKSLAHGNTAGVRIAAAPIVAMLEDHSYPDPKWAENILEAHKEGWAAVGPVVGNPNPKSVVSSVDFLLGFGTWSISSPSQTVDYLPTHVTSYKTILLREYGSELELMLESEILLNWDLKSRGHQLYLESKAKVYHRNFEILSSFLLVQFYSARVFAATRCEKWSRVRRFVYTCGSPLIPVKRLRSILSQSRFRSQFKHAPRWSFPTLCFALTASALGEMCGFALGPGNANTKRCEFEFHRERHARLK